MTTQQLMDLLAYLKTVKQNNVQTNQQAASPAAGGSSEWGALGKSIAKPVIKEGIKYGWKEYGSPLWKEYISPLYSETATGAGAGAGAAGGGLSTAAGTALTAGELATAEGAMYGSTAAGAGTAGAGAGSSAAASGLAGMTAGSWAAVAAPLIMAYLKYQAGSGRNDPKERRYQTQGANAMLSKILGGGEVDPSTTYQNYFMPAKKLPGWMDPNQKADVPTPGMETVDPRGYSTTDLYDWMHSIGEGAYSPTGTGQSGYSDQQIDDMIMKSSGLDKAGLSKALGYEIPDWSTIKYKDWYNQNNPAIKTPEGWDTLDPEVKGQYEQQQQQLGVQSNWSDNTTAAQLWRRKQEQDEIEKLLGRKLNPEPYQVPGTNYNW